MHIQQRNSTSARPDGVTIIERRVAGHCSSDLRRALEQAGIDCAIQPAGLAGTRRRGVHQEHRPGVAGRIIVRAGGGARGKAGSHGEHPRERPHRRVVAARHPRAERSRRAAARRHVVSRRRRPPARVSRCSAPHRLRRRRYTAARQWQHRRTNSSPRSRDAVGAHAQRGAMAEAPLSAQVANLAVMVVDGACIPLRRGRCDPISPLAGTRAAVVAGDAVAALGGSAMAVDVTIDESDDVVCHSHRSGTPSTA